MTRVLRIINRFNLGGPTYNAVYLTRYMPPGYETLLIGGMKDESEESSEFIARDLGIEPVIISSMKRSINPFDDLKAYNEIKKIIREFRPDIVHTHAAKAGALGRRAAFACKVPVTVHTFHGHVFHSYFGKAK
ncbi:MAG TPA: glycosyltransferase, partial [Bacteroidia bacterium]